MSIELKIGVKVYAIYNNKIVEGYLFSIMSPVPKIFEVLDIPMSPLILNEFFKLIDQMFEIFRKINNFNIETFVSGMADGNIENPYVSMGLNKLIERVFAVIDFRVLGAVIGRNLTGVDIRDAISMFVALTRVAIKSKTGDTKVISVPATSIFLTREDAENSLMGTGVKCLICSKEFLKTSDITKSLICKTCYDTINGFLSFDGLFNGVSLRSIGFKTKRKLEFSRMNDETYTDFTNRINDKIKNKYGRRINDGELVIDLDNTKISENSATISFKSYHIKVQSFFDPFNKTRFPLIKDVYERYNDFLNGTFNPKEVPIKSSSEHSFDELVSINSNVSNININNINENIFLKLYTKIKSAIVLKNIDNITVDLYYNSINRNTDFINLYTITGKDLKWFYDDSDLNNESKIYENNYENVFDVTLNSDNIKVGSNIVLATINYKNKKAIKSSAYTIIVGEDKNENISNNITTSGNVEDINNTEVSLDSYLNGTNDLYEELTLSNAYEFIPGSSNIVLNLYNESFFNVSRITKKCDDVNLNKITYRITKEDLQIWDLDLYKNLYANIDVSVKVRKISDGSVITGKIRNYQFSMFKKKDPANIIIDTLFMDELKYIRNGVSKDKKNRRYYVDNKEHMFSSNISADRNVEYFKMYIEFYRLLDKKPKKLEYETIVDLDDVKKSKYGLAVSTTYRVILPTQYIPSGDYEVIVRPIYKLDYHKDNMTVDISKVRNYLKRKAMYEWKVGESSTTKLKFINYKDSTSDTIVTMTINKDKSLTNLSNYGIKINKYWLNLKDSEYNNEINTYYEKIIDKLPAIFKNKKIRGINKNVKNGNEKTEIIFGYTNLENENMTMENRKPFIDFEDFYYSGEFQESINNAIIKRFENINLVVTNEYSIGNEFFIESELSVINSTKIDLEVGKEVWYTAQLGKTPAHVIFKGILASVSFGSISEIEKSEWKDVETKLLTKKTEAQLLLNLIPSVSETAPPFIPLVPLVPVHVDATKVYSTYDEAKKNSLFFLCPLCFKFKKPQDDLGAKKLRDFAKAFIENQKNATVDKIYNVTMADQLSNTLSTYKTKSTEILEDYKNIRQKNKTTNIRVDNSLFNKEYSNKYKEPESNSFYVYEKGGNRELYLKDKQERINDSTKIKYKEKNDTIIQDSLNYINDITVFDRDSVNNVLGKSTSFTTNKIKSKLSNTWVDKSKNKLMKSVNEAKKDFINNNNAAIAKVCDYLHVDTIDMSTIMEASDLPGSIKICTECQNKIAEWFGDLLKYLRDLLLDGVYDIDFVTQVFIDVMFDDETNEFTKFNFKYPETSDQRKKLEKEIKEVLEELK